MKKIKCPKCANENDFAIIEYLEVTNIFDIEDGIITDTQYDTADTSLLKIQAFCKKCKHSWTLRSLYNINDLDYIISDG